MTVSSLPHLNIICCVCVCAMNMYCLYLIPQPDLRTLELPLKYKDLCQSSLSMTVNPPSIVLMDVKKVCVQRCGA